MAVRILLALALGALTVLAQSGLRYDQLRDMLRSSVNQGLQDREIAKYLRNQTLAFSLSDSVLEDIQALGLGPKTMDALRKLQVESVALPAPDLTVPKKARGPRQPPPPSKEEQRRIIETARQNALEYTERLPDFVCLQVTRRYIDPSGLEMDWLKYDELKTRVSYFEGHENYDVVSVNNKVSERSLEELGGAVSTGEFGSLLRELFDPKTNAVFTWARHSLLRAKPVYVFTFRVPRPRSRWRLTYRSQLGDDEIISGYAGLVYIDKESERTLRIQMEAEDIPPAFAIRAASTRLDYDYIDISGLNFLLPLKAQARLRDGKLLSRNDVEFRLYRKFSAEATISFDEIDQLEPLPEEPAEETP